jgi:putative transposase
VKINVKSLCRGHRFPAAVISCAVRWYFRFQLGLHDVEELLFERGFFISYETVRGRCDKFGAWFVHRVTAGRRKPGNACHLDELFVTLCASLYRKQLTQRFEAQHRFLELTQNPSDF